MSRAVELDREHRLPAPEDELAVLDKQGCETCEQQLPAVRVAVHRLVDGNFEAPLEVIMLIARIAWRQALEKMLEIADEQGLIFVDGQAKSRVQRLQVHAPGPKARFLHRVAQPFSDVDEFSGVRTFEPQPPGDHAVAVNALRSSSRTGRLRLPHPAAAGRPSIAPANPTPAARLSAAPGQPEGRAQARAPPT